MADRVGGGSPHASREPLNEYITLEICNACGGLVGWSEYREGCCVGGIVCKRASGTRLIPLSAAATARPDREHELDLENQELARHCAKWASVANLLYEALTCVRTALAPAVVADMKGSDASLVERAFKCAGDGLKVFERASGESQ